MSTDWVPLEIDTQKPSVARAYDYLLGGKHNFAVDRDLANGLLRIEPRARMLARANRAFLGRAVRSCVDAGIRQYVDIGSGIPTAANVHEVAQARDPAARVVYVDNDPVAVAHSKAILDGNDGADAAQVDMRRPHAITRHPTVLGLIDLDRPVCILLVATLHLIPDAEDPIGIVAGLRDATVPGSCLVVSHLTNEDEPEKTAAIEKLYSRASSPAVPRSRGEILRFFDGYELLEPGLVYLPLWRPGPDDDTREPQRSMVLAGVGALR